jgi:4'-phosphopantetheinyl transferase
LLERTSSHIVDLPECDWADPPEAMSLPPDRVDLWKVPLTESEADLNRLERTLAPDEQARAERFRFDRDRRRFIVAHGRLRMILARYIGGDPQALVFSSGPRGKPFFAPPFQTALKFNLSHSGDLALVAVTLNRDIGVDLEEIHSFDSAERLAEQFFSSRENAKLRALPEAERLKAFFCCWTLKEAYVKATGDGLTRATDSFDVAFSHGELARLVSVEGDLGEASRWSLMRLTPAPGYMAALAVEGSGWTKTCWETRW